MEAQGTRAGWLTRSGVFLEPAASYQLAHSWRAPSVPPWTNRRFALGCGSAVSWQHRPGTPDADGPPHLGGTPATGPSSQSKWSGGVSRCALVTNGGKDRGQDTEKRTCMKTQILTRLRLSAIL